MSQERVQKRIEELITKRIKELDGGVDNNAHKNFQKGERLFKIPEIPLPRPVDILFQSPPLWLEVEGQKYTPGTLVKAFFINKKGRNANEEDTSVFISNCKLRIANVWGVVPLSTWHKQRNQYWDQYFVKALFTYVYLCDISPYKNVNRFSYTIRDDISIKEMKRLFMEANDKTVRIKAEKKCFK